MAKEDTATAKPARSLRGVKAVSQAFFTALESVPDTMRTPVAKAAQAMIREQLKLRQEKLRAAAAKEKARKPAAAPKAATAKPTPSKAASTRAKKTAAAPEPAPAPVKRRTRRTPVAAAA